ncbi:MAG: Na/Pi cotransporter family protein [Balneolaceae bacterium]
MSTWISQFDALVFFAGLGVFLFAMHLMEESIRELSASALKRVLRKATETRPSAIASGAASAAVLQSSSAVSLMVLAFTGAGMMTLVQAISVMMGAKIGTTVTAWLVAVFGFEFSLEAVTLPLIAVGGLGIIVLSRSKKYVNISRFLVAFGLLFLGLDYMKVSVENLAEWMDPNMLAGYGILVFALAGLLFTAVMQSSSATIALVLTALFSGLLTFEQGAAMVVGANVGTTVTVLLGSIGGLQIKKQAAVSQMVFTTGTAAIALLVLPALIWLSLEPFGLSGNLVLGLALFHSLFNILGVLMFYPFIGHLADQVERWIPEKRTRLTRFIHKTEADVPEAALVSLRREQQHFLVQSIRYIRSVVSRPGGGQTTFYPDLAAYHGEIFAFHVKMRQNQLDEPVAQAADDLMRAGRYMMNATRNMHYLTDDLQSIAAEPSAIYTEAAASIKKRMELFHDCSSRYFDKQHDTYQSLWQQAGLLRDELEMISRKLEEGDKEFIKRCGDAFVHPDMTMEEVTRLLMVNRNTTESGRMLYQAMQIILEEASRQGAGDDR